MNVTGSISEEIDFHISESLLILQGQKDIKSMIQDYELKRMSVLEEINFFQYILAAGIVWVMPDSYIKRVEDSLDKNLIYFN